MTVALTRILLVDDDDALRCVLARALTKHGFLVQTAQNGEEALEFYNLHGADILILDIIMPVKDGIEILMELRKRPRKPRLIAMSGGGRISAELCLAFAEACQVDFVLEKPFSIDDLLNAIGQVKSRKDRR
jgi:CheY-like chemotaxis protein